MKKIVLDLDVALANAETIADDHEYFVAMSKSAGLASGITQEAVALIADIYQAMKSGNKTAPTDTTSLLSSLMGGGKGGGLGGTGGVN